MTSSAHFVVGSLYSNEEIFKTLGVGNAGGLRFKILHGHVTRAAVFTSVPSARKQAENPYHDRIEGDVLIYTAAGREGDQTLSGMNKRLSDQRSLNFPIHGFLIVANRKTKSVGPKRWRYLGLLEYQRHFRDTQVDIRGTVRNVWVFEMRVHSTPSKVPLGLDSAIMRDVLQISRRANPPTDDDALVARSVNADNDLRKADPVKIEALRGKLIAVPPQKFEHLLKEILCRTGFTTVEVTKFSQDGGIDLNAHLDSWAMGKCLLQVQAKRWVHSVGRKEVAELRGSLQPNAKGALITTSHFTKAALLEAREPGKFPINLVDGFNLAHVIIENSAEEILAL